jgi:hypothetical protein
VDDHALARERVAVHGRHQRLRDRLEELFWGLRGQPESQHRDTGECLPQATHPQPCVAVRQTHPTGTHQVRAPERLAHAKELLAARAAHDKVLGEHLAADQVRLLHVSESCSSQDP